ncbi:carboxylesterase [Collimonas arenae]|uniref:Carboxylesterase n=1 Tax=Collimonas arenae TaxID=279058 RepID=A0A0A1FH01_9BURK|nr:alpha/beta hydrolase [Collimonas arenae]AIY42894.1 carboxylesterase [Collimonas arenae]
MPPPNVFPSFKSDEAKERYIAAYDALLRDWPVPYQELNLATRLGPTYVIASGPADAPPLVLLPSFAGSATIWRLNVARLSRHYRIYAVDVIGQPGKSLTNRRLRNRHEYANWLVDLLDALDVQRASIVGCSFGGFLALNQASLTPERVDRVVLINPVGTFASQFWKLFYSARIKRPIVKLGRRLVGSKKIPSLADLGIRPPRDAKWSALMATMMSSVSKLSIITPSVLSGRELRSIRTPALLLIGDAEKLYDPVAMLTLAQKRMPTLKGGIVPDADHIAAMAQPDDVNERIIRFLQSDDDAMDVVSQ